MRANEQAQSSCRVAFIALALMLIYFAVDNHAPLKPSNNLAPSGSQWPSTLAGWIPGLFTLWALWRRSRRAVGVGAVWTVVWCLLQVRQWWIPYLFGPTPLHRDFRWYVEHGYTETLRILPRRGARPTPDLQHMILQTLSLSAAVLTVRAYIKMGSAPRRTA
jgi:hypothetical protein